MQTQEFSKTMGVSQRTAATWAQNGRARARKVSGRWIFDEGEPERLWHEWDVNFFMSCGHTRDMAEIMARLVGLDDEVLESFKRDLSKIVDAFDAGMNATRFNELVSKERLLEVGLDAMIAESMPTMQ